MDRPRAVTFDCWSTLLYEQNPGGSFETRVAAVARISRSLGHDVDEATARKALGDAWGRHVTLWQQGIGSGAPEMAAWTLEALGLPEPGRAAEALAHEIAEASTGARIHPLEGAVDTLEQLARAGVRRALVCDTGFSPGRVVRRHLERAGLLDLLEVCVFSDEAGVPKPHPRVFHAALEPLGVAPGAAVHVGDLRRTDVAGGRGVGMGTVRIRDHHDDQSELPDADAVADTHAHLLELLRL